MSCFHQKQWNEWNLHVSFFFRFLNKSKNNSLLVLSCNEKSGTTVRSLSPFLSCWRFYIALLYLFARESNAQQRRAEMMSLRASHL